MTHSQLFLLITGADGSGRAVARPVGADPERAGAFRLEEESFPVLPALKASNKGSRAVLPRPLDAPHLAMPELRQGDLVRAACIGWPDGEDMSGVAVQLLDGVEFLARGVDEGRATSLVAEAAAAERAEPHLIHAADSRDVASGLAWEADAERARHQENTALIVAWVDDRGEIDTHILDHTGSFLFWNYGQHGHSCHDNGVDIPEQPGLWLLTEGQSWSSRDWESGVVDGWGLSGKIAPITPEEAAARFGWTDAEHLRADVEEAYPYVFEGDVFEALPVNPSGAPAPGPAPGA